MRRVKAIMVAVLIAAPVHVHAFQAQVTAFVAHHGELTSTQSKPRLGRTVAVSRDLRHLVGRKIHIKGVGCRRVESVTHLRLRNTVDLLVANRATAKRFGRKTAEVRVAQ